MLSLIIIFYLQLRHAFLLQVGSLVVGTWPSVIETLLLDNSLEKALSGVYKELFQVTLPSVVHCRKMWVENVLDLQREDWENMCNYSFKHRVSTRDHPLQFNFLHRIDLTHVKLVGIYSISRTRLSAGSVFMPLLTLVIFSSIV